jgi:hypothetical protein
VDDRPLFEKDLEDILPTELQKRPIPRRSRPPGPPVWVLPFAELRAIAQLQRLLVLVFGATLVAGLIGAALGFGLTQAQVEKGITITVLASAVVIGTLQLATSVLIVLLGSRVFSGGVFVVVLLGGFVPCLAPVMLLIVNGQATAILRSNGIRVGFFGARSADVKRVAV